MQPSLQTETERQTPRIRLLRAAHAQEVANYLSRDVVRNLFMLSWLDNYGVSAPGRPDLFHFRGIFAAGTLVGVALTITDRLVLLQTDDAETARRFGRWYRDNGYRFEHVVSTRRCVTPFWAAYSAAPDDGIRARLDRPQELHVLQRSHWDAIGGARHVATPGDVRLASTADRDAVFWASAKMHAEETLEDPLERNAGHFRRHVEHRIDNGRTYVWFDDHRRLLFKADVSAQSPYGVQVSGVYTPPALRGRGLATRGMLGVCNALFARGFPRVTLYVNRSNAPARRVYEKVGFEYHTAYQTVFVEQA